jgi:hypothetical protein
VRHADSLAEVEGASATRRPWHRSVGKARSFHAPALGIATSSRDSDNTTGRAGTESRCHMIRAHGCTSVSQSDLSIKNRGKVMLIKVVIAIIPQARTEVTEYVSEGPYPSHPCPSKRTNAGDPLWVKRRTLTKRPVAEMQYR